MSKLKQLETELEILNKLEKRYRRQKLTSSNFYIDICNRIVNLESDTSKVAAKEFNFETTFEEGTRVNFKYFQKASL